MLFSLRVAPDGATDEGLAPLEVRGEDGSQLCRVDLQYSKLEQLPRPSPQATDFLLIASAIYALDKLVLRDRSEDRWTREFSLAVPVSDVAIWNRVKGRLEHCVSFLTGDHWRFEFLELQSALVRKVRRRHRARRQLLAPPNGDAVCLCSGGLDSLIGAIDWLESHADRKLLLVGHHDAQMGGPFTDQKELLKKLRTAYSGRVSSILVRIGHTDESVDKTEITLRSRSLLFVAIGTFAASALGLDRSLIIPENGTIALNVPLTPSRRGSCSTRTAHPHYLTGLADVLKNVGVMNGFTNPLERKTKGEAVSACLNRSLLAATARLSVSCAKRGHRVHWTHRDARACGRCMPCIFRRAALHTVGWDDETYGDDMCRGEGGLHNSGGKSGSDVRACLSFLNARHSVEGIASMLLASGSLDPSRLFEGAELIQRAMEEIRTLIREKGIAEVRRLAGV